MKVKQKQGPIGASENLEAAAAYLGRSEILSDSLPALFGGVGRIFRGDLKDIWSLLNALETLTREVIG